MACGQSFYEENPAKDKALEERRLRRNKENADKIVNFFKTNLGKDAVTVRLTGTASHEVKKIFAKRTDAALIILHRGYEISVSCASGKWLLELEHWNRTGNMSHARVIRQDH